MFDGLARIFVGSIQKNGMDMRANVTISAVGSVLEELEMGQNPRLDKASVATRPQLQLTTRPIAKVNSVWAPCMIIGTTYRGHKSRKLEVYFTILHVFEYLL